MKQLSCTFFGPSVLAAGNNNCVWRNIDVFLAADSYKEATAQAKTENSDSGLFYETIEERLDSMVDSAMSVCWDGLTPAQRAFIVYYSKKPAFLYAHGGEHRGKWFIYDGNKPICLQHWLAKKQKQHGYDCFFCFCCNPAGLNVQPVDSALLVLPSTPIIADGVVGMLVYGITSSWSITHPKYGDLEYITEYVLEQEKKEKT